MTVAALPGAVLFDWDNTLVDSWQTIHEALNLTFAAMGTPAWTLDETKARTRLSLRDAFPVLFGDRWTEARRIYLETFEAIHLERLRPIEGAEAQLQQLDAAGIYMALVSNKTGRLLRREVEALDWVHFFGRIVGAGDAANDKPHRAPIDLALDGSGWQAGDAVWYVGDTGVDVECAVNAGCVPVLLHAGDPGLAPAPRFRFDGFQALGAAVRRLVPCKDDVA